MKRDMDLIRNILLALEKYPPGQQVLGSQLLSVCNDSRLLGAHLKLLIDAHYLEGSDNSGLSGPSAEMIHIVSISWTGHDLINTIRDEGVWADIQKALLKVGGATSLEVLKQLATKISLGYLGLS